VNGYATIARLRVVPVLSALILHCAPAGKADYPRERVCGYAWLDGFSCNGAVRVPVCRKMFSAPADSPCTDDDNCKHGLHCELGEREGKCAVDVRR
jgi:hypothetical protein